MYPVGPGSNLITLLEVDLRTRILIADDHPIFRSGLKAELSRHADFEIAGEAVDGHGGTLSAPCRRSGYSCWAIFSTS